MASLSVTGAAEDREGEVMEETCGIEVEGRADLASTAGEHGEKQPQDQLQGIVSLLTDLSLLPTDTVPMLLGLPDLPGLFSAPGERGLLVLERLQVCETLSTFHHRDRHSSMP
jgi:hypothetical protein